MFGPSVTNLPGWWFAILIALTFISGTGVVTGIRALRYTYPARHSARRIGSVHGRRIAWGVKQ